MATVLVVDDSMVDREIAGAFVKQEGATVVYAEHGVEALEIIERDLPDIVLTDLQMPEMDGLQLVEHLHDNLPKLPVILMTAWGSEDTAVTALRAGAVSYLPKKEMKRDIGEALRSVLATVESTREREKVCRYLQHSESYYLLDYDPAGPQALISYLQASLAQLDFCDESGLSQVSMALIEALTNALDHGNLELDSALRELGDSEYRDLGNQRSKQSPYCDRRVHITSRLTPTQATFVIRDEGPGFDVSSLPDPTDPENLLKPSGRGVTLIHAFMDEVQFNDLGNEITMIKHQ